MAESVAIDAARETVSEDSLGLDGLTAELTTPPLEEVEETEESETVEEPEVEAEDVLEPDEESTIDPEVAQILDGLTDAQRTELSKAWGGRAGERIGQLTAKNKQLEESINQLSGELKKREPIEEAAIGDNPYQDKTDPAELESIFQAAHETIDSWGDILDDHEDSLMDEEIGDLDGKPLTKRDAKRLVRNARKAIPYLKARSKQVAEAQQFVANREARRPAVEELHPWLTDETSDWKKAFDVAEGVFSPIVSEKAPYYLPFLDLVLADHIKADSERNQARSDTKPARKQAAGQQRRVPSSPGGAGGASSRPAVSASKQAAAKAAQFDKSDGREADVAALFL